MDDRILTAAENTAVIIVHAIKAHTSLCIPGATDVRSVLTMTQRAPLVADLHRGTHTPEKA
jgi:hypothetical protein